MEPIFNPLLLNARLDELRTLPPSELLDLQERSGYVLYNGDDSPAPRVPRGFERVCVRVDREYDNIKVLTGADGARIELEINPDYQPTHHVREWATVIARPFASDETFRTRQGCANELLPGDKVYLHYHAITEEYRYEVDGVRYYLIPYEMCYCAVRGGRILMLGDYVLTAPIVRGVGAQATATGIIVNPHTEARLDAQLATVAHAPAGVDSGIAPGRQVFFLTDADLPLTVEGVPYFIMHASDLIGFQDLS